MSFKVPPISLVDFFSKNKIPDPSLAQFLLFDQFPSRVVTFFPLIISDCLFSPPGSPFLRMGMSQLTGGNPFILQASDQDPPFPVNCRSHLCLSAWVCRFFLSLSALLDPPPFQAIIFVFSPPKKIRTPSNGTTACLSCPSPAGLPTRSLLPQYLSFCCGLFDRLLRAFFFFRSVHACFHKICPFSSPFFFFLSLPDRFCFNLGGRTSSATRSPRAALRAGRRRLNRFPCGHGCILFPQPFSFWPRRLLLFVCRFFSLFLANGVFSTKFLMLVG